MTSIHLSRCIGNLGSITHLDLSGNDLTGRLPASIGELAQLRVLKVADNLLKDEIPKSINRLVRLGGNASIYFLLFIQTSLEHLDLSHNNFNGYMPPLNNMTSLM